MRRGWVVGVVLAMAAGPVTASAPSTAPAYTFIAPCTFEFRPARGLPPNVQNADGWVHASAVAVSTEPIVTTQIDCEVRFYRSDMSLCDISTYSAAAAGPAAQLFNTVKLPLLCGSRLYVEACTKVTWFTATNTYQEVIACTTTRDDSLPYAEADEMLVVGGLVLTDTDDGVNDDSGLKWQAYGVLTAWTCVEQFNLVATVVCTPPLTSLTSWRCATWFVYASALGSGQARGAAQCTNSPWIKTDPVTSADLPAVEFGAQYADVVVKQVTCSAHDSINNHTNATYTVACLDPETADWLLADLP